MRLDGLAGAGIPYYGMMKKAMPGPAQQPKKKFKKPQAYRDRPHNQKAEVKKWGKYR